MTIFHAQGFRPDGAVPTMLDQLFTNEADALDEVRHCLKGATVTVASSPTVGGCWTFLCEDGSRFVIEPRTVH